MKVYKRLLLILALTVVASTLVFIGSTSAQNGRSSRSNPTLNKPSAKQKAAQAEEEKKIAAKLKALRAQDKIESYTPIWSEAVAFAETPAVRDLPPAPLSRTKNRRMLAAEAYREKNETNIKSIRPGYDGGNTAPFEDPTLKSQPFSRSIMPSLVTNPIVNFDGTDMDAGAVLLGGRFAPPDTNAAAGPNHVVLTTNAGFQVYSKAGVPLTPLLRISSILVGIPNAADDDGDPIVLYDWMADRWMIMQFNLRFTNNQMHMHFAVSKTPDPTGQYYAYDFLTTAGRFSDYPHVGVWPNGYYMSTNDFNQAGTAFLGAGMYALERAKMLVGDPTAKIIGFNTGPTNGGMLPTNHQGYTPPPAGVPNLFFEFDADEFGAPFDLVRTFALVPDYAVPANSTLTPGPNIPTAAFDARNPSGRSDIDQLATADGLDSIADRFMHALNFRVLPGGVQSYVGNFTVNVSGVNPTSKALYQAGIRWLEFRRNPGTGVISINQDATYAPGSGNGATGRDLWMAAVGQDGEGNIALGASASSTTINPTAIYAGRLAGDPINTLPQGEVDALAAVIKGSQTGTGNRWGDYSSIFSDPSDDCTFWGAFEYVDGPTSSFDWNTRIFSFKVNPQCVTPQKGTLQFNVTNCETGLPIENATVTLDGNFYGATLANGQFSTVKNPGSVAYSVTKPSFSVVAGNTTVVNGQTTVVNVCLVGVPTLGAGAATLVQESCPPPNSAVDPGETVTMNLAVVNSGGGSTSNLVGTLLPSANVLAPSGPQNYGALAPGGTLARNFTFTAQGNCGDLIPVQLQLQDGAANLGTVIYFVRLGVQNTITALSQNFDGVVAPALPAGWTSAATGVEVPWVTSTTASFSAPNNAFAPDPSNIGNTELFSPSLAIPAGGAQLTFRNNFNTEPNFDGMVLEISINGGAYADIIGAGGSFVAGGYNSTISTSFGSPIGGRAAWSGNSGGYIVTTVNLPAAANGQNIQLKWRMATDNSVAATGVRVDNIVVSATEFICNTNCAGAPRISTTVALSCNGSQVRAVYTLSNSGTATANNVTLTTARIGAVNGTPLPQNLGNLAPGASAQATVFFTGAPSGIQTVVGGGTHAGGTFEINRRMNVPNCVVIP